MLRRRFPTLVVLSTVAFVLAGSIVSPASAIDFQPFVTVNAAPGSAKVTVGQHFEGTEFSNTTPLANGAVGPLPVFMADDTYGCAYPTAIASGVTRWIALAQRDSATPPTPGDACPAFEQKVAAAEAAGASAVIVINSGPGTAAGTAAGGIPGVIIDQTEGENLQASLSASNPSAVQVTLGLLDSTTFLPPGSLFPTTVDSLQASPGSGAVSVSGGATFGTQPPVVVGTDDAGDGVVGSEAPQLSQLDDNLGTDLVSADVSVPDPTEQVLQFRWHITGLPRTGAIPEATFYRWGITVNGTTNYVLQAKFSNLISLSVLDDPQGVVTNIGASFQLRGSCGQENVGGQNLPLNNCHSLAFLTGSLNTSTDTVSIDLPMGQSYDEDIVPGASLTPYNYDTQPIVAGASVFASEPFEEDGMDWDQDAVPAYTIPSPQVLLGIAPAGTDVSNVSFGTPGTLKDDGSFSGSVSTAGLASGSYDVWAKACFATNCQAQKVTVSL